MSKPSDLNLVIPDGYGGAWSMTPYRTPDPPQERPLVDQVLNAVEGICPREWSRGDFWSLKIAVNHVIVSLQLFGTLRVGAQTFRSRRKRVRALRKHIKKMQDFYMVQDTTEAMVKFAKKGIKK